MPRTTHARVHASASRSAAAARAASRTSASCAGSRSIAFPIDLVAGTSMGGLIGGAFASGMSADELEPRCSSNRLGRDVRRLVVPRTRTCAAKQDARAYPRGSSSGSSAACRCRPRSTTGSTSTSCWRGSPAPYHGSRVRRSADALPRGRRRSRQRDAGRARSRLAGARRCARRCRCPASFRRSSVDGRVLVDGGAMNNVPADVVRAMGADVVIAVNVGSWPTRARSAARCSA